MKNKEKNAEQYKKGLGLFLIVSFVFLFSMANQALAKGEVEGVPKDILSDTDKKVIVGPNVAQSRNLPIARSLAIPPPPQGSSVPLTSYFAPPNGLFTGVTDNGNMLVFTNDNWQYGTMWAEKTIDLTKDFKFAANLYLGDEGKKAADGITFTLHRDGRGTSAISAPPPTTILDKEQRRGQTMGVYGSNGHFTSKYVEILYRNYVKNALTLEFDTFLNYREGHSYQDYDIYRKRPTEVEFNHNGHIAQSYTHLNNDYVKDMGPQHSDPVIATRPMSNGHWKKIEINWKAASRTLSVDYVDPEWTTKQSTTYTESKLKGLLGGDISQVYWGFSGATGGNSAVNAMTIQQMPQEPNPPTPQKNGVEHKATIQNITTNVGEGTSTPGKPNDTVRLKSITTLKKGFSNQGIGTITATLDENLTYVSGTAYLNGANVSSQVIKGSGNTLILKGINLDLSTTTRTINNFTIDAKVDSNAPKTGTLSSSFNATGGDIEGNLPTSPVNVTLKEETEPSPQGQDITASVRNNSKDQDSQSIHSPKDSQPYFKMKVKPTGGTIFNGLTFVAQLAPGTEYVVGSAKSYASGKIPTNNVSYNKITNQLTITDRTLMEEIDIQLKFEDNVAIGIPLNFYYEVRGVPGELIIASNNVTITVDPLPQQPTDVVHNESITNGVDTGLSVNAKAGDTVVLRDIIEVTSITPWQDGILEIIKDKNLEYKTNTLIVNGVVVPPNNMVIENDKIIIKTFPSVQLNKSLEVKINAVVKDTVTPGDSYFTRFVAKEGNLPTPKSSKELEVKIKNIGTHRITHIDNEKFAPIPGQPDIVVEGEVGSTYTIRPTIINGYEYVGVIPANDTMTITFQGTEQSSSLIYRKSELKFLKVPNIDFGTIETTTNATVDNYPEENIQVSVKEQSIGPWKLMLKMKESFKTSTDIPLNGSFYFKNGSTAKQKVTTNSQLVFDSKTGTGSGPQRDIIWDRTQGQGMSFVNEPGNLPVKYEGIFQWDLEDTL